MDNHGEVRASAPPSGDERVGYAGKPGLVGLICKNFFLTLITIGIYRFWAATRLRRYLWSNVQIAGDPLEYTGSGRELFLGFLVALAFLAPLTIAYAVLQRLALGNAMLAGTLQLLYLTALFVFFQIASFRSRRYRLSRTRWRGIYAAQTGSALHYLALAFGYSALTLVTLGLAMPWTTVALQRYKLRNTWFGDRAMTIEARGAPLFWPWLLLLLIALMPLAIALVANAAFLSQLAHLSAATRGAGAPNLALPHPGALGLLAISIIGGFLAFAWYRTTSFRYLASRTRLGDAQLVSTARGASVVGSILLFALGGVAVSIAIAIVFFVLGGAIAAVLKGFVADRAFDPKTAVVIGFVAMIPAYILMILVFRIIWYCWLWIPILRHVVTTLEIRNFAAVHDIAQSRAPRQKLGIADSFELGAF